MEQPDKFVLVSKAYENAMDRLEAIPPSGVSPDVELAFAAIGEALLWAVVLEKTLESKEYLGKPFYRRERDRDSDGYLVNGLRFARNQLLHEPQVVELLDSRDIFADTFGNFFVDWCWICLTGNGRRGGANLS